MKKLLLFIICLLPLVATAQRSHYYYQRATLFEALPVDNDDIIMFGNSITDGCEWSELLQNPNVKNRGISGDIVDGLNERLHAITDGKPAKIFLLIGINDLSWHTIPTDTIGASILKLVDRIHQESPTTRVYVQSILPVNSSVLYKSVEGKDDDIISINKRLKTSAKEHNYTYIDVYSSLVAPDSKCIDPQYSNDGLHLLGGGYLVWAKILQPYVNE